ncbi:MAG: phospho-sugar mutase [Clostridiales bacterium]|nr:phospho-sugar mutase [Clostridiales bacterium]
MDIDQLYEAWCKKVSEPDLLEELNLIRHQEKEIESRFYKQLSFGTAGLRAEVGVGCARMNVYTVSKATQGLAQYLKKQGLKSGVAIACDSRRKSTEFAQVAACVLAQNGIKAYLFDQIMPTPVLSFTVRHLHCDAGVVVTASHNPKEYNGYKVYNEQGGQITDQMAQAIAEEMQDVAELDVQRMGFDQAIVQGKIKMIGDEVLSAYVENVMTLKDSCTEEERKQLKVVYSPLHGTGAKPVQIVLKQAGFTDVHPVEAQCVPDTEFSTLRLPNPEEVDALKMAIEQAKACGADLVIATDPDADRMGTAIRNAEGEYVPLTGNQIGCLLLNNRLRDLKAQDKLQKDDFIVKSIVTTQLAKSMADAYGVKLYNVLTGFKYIGEKIEQYGQEHQFIFGFEESYGFLAGTFVRDKDAVIASLLLCQAAAKAKAEGKTLLDELDLLLKTYGYHAERVKSYTLQGMEGAERIKEIMRTLREQPPKQIAGSRVIENKDYAPGIDGFPCSDVLYYTLENDQWVCVRPSGTEPKIKFYGGAKGKDVFESQKILDDIIAWSDAVVG